MLCFLETPVLRFALLPYYRRNITLLLFWVILMHELMTRLCRVSAKLTNLIVSLTSPHALKIARILAALTWFQQTSLVFPKQVCCRDRIIWLILVLKMQFWKIPPKDINYRDFRKFEIGRFMNPSQSTLGEENTDYNRNPDNLFKYSTLYSSLTHPKRKSM